jgi:hypothetical protein
MTWPHRSASSEIGRAQQDREALVFYEMQDDVPKLASRQRVNTDGGFVQQHEFRRSHERAGKAELLLHTAGQLSRQPPGKGRKGGHLQKARILPLPLGRADTVQIGIEVEVLLDTQILVKAEFLRHVSDTVLDGLWLCHDVDVQHVERAGIRGEEPGDQADQRRLPGAVGAD